MLFQAPFACDCWTKFHKSFTPDGKSLATVLNDFKIEIRDSSTGNLISTLRCIDKVDHIEWSPNGRHILTSMHERNAVHVFTPPTHPTQASARIDGGELGIEYVIWSPNSQHLVVFGKNGIRADIWELRTSRLTALPGVKHTKKGGGFSPNKKVFGYITRRDGGDVLSLHSVEDWRVLNVIELGTLDAREMQWSPDGVLVAVADCEIEHRVVVANSETGTISTYSAYEGQKGVTHMCWCVNSHLLAIGCGDDSIHILFAPDWKLLTSFSHIPITRGDNADHYEEESPGRFEKAGFPIKNFDTNVSGINRMSWSHAGRYIASTTKSYTRTLFIWDIEALCLLHVFTFLTPISEFKWSPTDENLAVAVGTDKLLNWKPDGFHVSHSQEAAVQIHMIDWRSDGECLAAFDNAAGTCTLAFLADDDGRV